MDPENQHVDQLLINTLNFQSIDFLSFFRIDGFGHTVALTEGAKVQLVVRQVVAANNLHISLYHSL